MGGCRRTAIPSHPRGQRLCHSRMHGHEEEPGVVISGSAPAGSESRWAQPRAFSRVLDRDAVEAALAAVSGSAEAHPSHATPCSTLGTHLRRRVIGARRDSGTVNQPGFVHLSCESVAAHAWGHGAATKPRRQGRCPPGGQGHCPSAGLGGSAIDDDALDVLHLGPTALEAKGHALVHARGITAAGAVGNPDR